MIEKKRGGGRRKSRLLLFNSISFFFTGAFLQTTYGVKVFFCHANRSELLLYKFILERLQLLFRTIISFKWFISEMVFPSLEITKRGNNA